MTWSFAVRHIKMGRSIDRASSASRGAGRKRRWSVLWQNADRLASGLVTQDGRRLKVLYPGRRSSSAGPDFRDCVLSTDSGDIVVGDVEVHVNAGGWRAHGHHIDSNYNGVVLHVVLAPSGRSTTTLESRAEAPVAAIGVVQENENVDADPRRRVDEDPSVSALCKRHDRAGDERFRSKAGGVRHGA